MKEEQTKIKIKKEKTMNMNNNYIQKNWLKKLIRNQDRNG